MNQTTITNAASAAAEKSKNIIVAQIDKQAHVLGTTVTQTARDLEQVGNQLRQSGTIGSAAQLADWAAGYVQTAGAYLENGDTAAFISDLEGFSRQRPWAVAASAAVLGFAAARVIKSASVRRSKSSDYVAKYSDDYAYESASVNPTSSPSAL